MLSPHMVRSKTLDGTLENVVRLGVKRCKVGCGVKSVSKIVKSMALINKSKALTDKSKPMLWCFQIISGKS